MKTGDDDVIRPTNAGRAGVNLFGLFREASARSPDRPAFVAGARTWTFGEVDRKIRAFSDALAALGLRPQDRVLVQARNGLPLFLSAWATWHAGGIWAPVNARLSPAEIAYMAERSGAKVFLCDPAYADHARAAAEAVPSLRVVWTERGGPRPADEVSLDEILERATPTDRPAADVTVDTPCWMFFTSGTTGRPKAALLGHTHMASVVMSFLADVLPGSGCEEVFLAIAPLSHGAGVQMLANVARGATTIVSTASRLDVDEVWTLVERHRVTNVFAVPTILKALVEHPAVHRHDRASLKRITYSGSPMYRVDQKRALETLGPVIVQLYGLAEVTAGITVLPPEEHTLDDADPRAASCGFARTGMEIAILDEAGHPLAAGRTGTVAAKGPNVFLGYFDDPDANAKAFRQGWFVTGDLGHLDGSGFLFLTGRASDMFISGGNNVYPREVEEALLEDPAIREVAVFGVPDPFWGEIGIAVAVANYPHETTEAAVLGRLAGRLSKYKWPRCVVFWPELPKSGYGKVPKTLVRDAYLAGGPPAG